MKFGYNWLSDLRDAYNCQNMRVHSLHLCILALLLSSLLSMFPI